MTLEVLVTTDPGETPKRIKVDGSLRGSSSGPGSNFDTLLQEYRLDGRKIYGTKSVVVDQVGFMDSLKNTYALDDVICRNIKSNYSNEFKNCLNDAEAWVVFWDRTSEVHHRDMMRHCYAGIKAAIDQEVVNIEDREYETERDQNKAIEDMEKLEYISLEMDEALNDLYEAKVAQVKISNIAKDMLRYSQGYQLSSERSENHGNLWKSRILKLQLDSGITNDQRKYGIDVSGQPTLDNVGWFLGAFDSTDFYTGKFEIPSTHEIDQNNLRVSSTTTQRNRNGCYVNMVLPKDLRVVYVN